MNNLNYP